MSFSQKFHQFPVRTIFATVRFLKFENSVIRSIHVEAPLSCMRRHMVLPSTRLPGCRSGSRRRGSKRHRWRVAVGLNRGAASSASARTARRSSLQIRRGSRPPAPVRLPSGDHQPLRPAPRNPLGRLGRDRPPRRSPRPDRHRRPPRREPLRHQVRPHLRCRLPVLQPPFDTTTQLNALLTGW